LTRRRRKGVKPGIKRRAGWRKVRRRRSKRERDRKNGKG
jgi:hypothetical protein